MIRDEELAGHTLQLVQAFSYGRHERWSCLCGGFDVYLAWENMLYHNSPEQNERAREWVKDSHAAHANAGGPT